MSNEDELLFADEGLGDGGESKHPWKILIADDEEEVHAVTRMVLDNFVFENHGVELFSAYSGKDTMQILREHPDTAVLLLDVVMENDTTGLEVVRYIRDELQNNFVRIILRTGQPGQAPERQVTMEYDINDYKEKTELTAQKLFTTVIGLLRAYRDLRTIEKNRQGLERIASISSSLFKQQSLKTFIPGLLIHLAALLDFDDSGIEANHSAFAASRQGEELHILTGIGTFKAAEDRTAREALPEHVFQQLRQSVEQKQSLSFDDAYIAYFITKSGLEHLIYTRSLTRLSELDLELMHVLEVNVMVALENIELNQAIVETQREVMFTLGEVVMTRSKKAKQYVKNVASYVYLLARKSGMNEEDADMLRLASPLHDVGTLGIPDEVLHKQVALNKEEEAIMKKHPLLGHKILQEAKQPILRLAATVALQHHECWDGSGYPEGLKGNAIHRCARILSLAGSFNELRASSEAEIEQMKAYFVRERGTRFDPELVDLFLEHLDDFLSV